MEASGEGFPGWPGSEVVIQGESDDPGSLVQCDPSPPDKFLTASVRVIVALYRLPKQSVRCRSRFLMLLPPPTELGYRSSLTPNPLRNFRETAMSLPHQGIHLTTETLTQIRALALPGESIASVIQRAVLALHILEAESPQHEPETITQRMDALENRLERIETRCRAYQEMEATEGR